MLQNIGMPELLIILLVVLIFFGPKFLKEMAQNMGKAGRELKNINEEYKEAIDEIQKEDEKPAKKSVIAKSKKKGGEKN